MNFCGNYRYLIDDYESPKDWIQYYNAARDEHEGHSSRFIFRIIIAILD